MTIEEILKKDPNDFTMDDFLYLLDNSNGPDHLKDMISLVDNNLKVKINLYATNYKLESDERRIKELEIKQAEKLRMLRACRIDNILYGTPLWWVYKD